MAKAKKLNAATDAAEVNPMVNAETLRLLNEGLLPEEIEDGLSARPNGVDEEKVLDYALSFMKVGQLVPITVLKSGEGYTLEMGEHRRAAARLINEGFTYADDNGKEITVKPRGEDEKFKLKCIVSARAGGMESFQASILENLKRKNYNAMEVAELIAQIREMNNWVGGVHTRKVANYLDVSPSTITQHEKLGTLPDDVKAQITSGLMTGAAALELANVKPEKKSAVAKRAAELAAEDTSRNTGMGSATAAGVKAGKGKKADEGDGEGGNGNGGDGEGNAPVKAKHVQQAAQEADANTKPIKKKMKDWLKLLESEAGPANPKPVNDFVTTFVSWADGELKKDGAGPKVTDKLLIQKFRKMFEK